MGFLAAGEPLEWDDSLNSLEHVRKHGIRQFIRLYDRVAHLQNDKLLYGDELEYQIFKLSQNKVKIALRGAQLLNKLNQKEKDVLCQKCVSCAWAPEFGAWMVEGTPGKPYHGYAADLLTVEHNMRVRRARVLSALDDGEICPTMTCFPMLGVGDFVEPPPELGVPRSASLFVPDDCINPHPRFGTLVENIRRRRGTKVDIRMPRFRDERTPRGTPAGCPPPSTLEEALAMDEVYMDAMAFGMGCCCLQVTFQARDVAESRHLYDHLAVLSPIMLALTAATPIARGVLLDTDTRWSIIAQSVDDRTDAERGVGGAPPPPARAASAMAGGGSRPLQKSRYDSISSFICNHLSGVNPEAETARYNDLNAPYDAEAYQALVDGGVDEILSRHIAHLFVRDPLVIYKNRIDVEEGATDHFENIQSTNWQTVRWKPPPAKAPLSGDNHIGWRTEFRSMEVQLTDFENAAFTVFIVLVSRIILYFDLNLYVPISKVDENMRRASERDACTGQKFWFRQSSVSPCCDGGNKEPELAQRRRERLSGSAVEGGGGDLDGPGAFARVPDASCCGELPTQEITIFEILAGRGEYKGLVPMIMAYLDMINTDSYTMSAVSKYMDFICARASGELQTPAAWMRSFVRSHPAYKHDSNVPMEVAADLCATCHRIGVGSEKVPELFGSFDVHQVLPRDAYEAPLSSENGDGHSVSRSSADGLMKMYQLQIALTSRRRQLQAAVRAKRVELQHAESELASIEEQLSILHLG